MMRVNLNPSAECRGSPERTVSDPHATRRGMSITILIACGAAASLAIIAAARFGIKLATARRDREERRVYLLKRLGADHHSPEAPVLSLPG